jgi:hypothetical protein
VEYDQCVVKIPVLVQKRNSTPHLIVNLLDQAHIDRNNFATNLVSREGFAYSMMHKIRETPDAVFLRSSSDRTTGITSSALNIEL